MYTCASCGKLTCRSGGEDYPKNCPTLEEGKLEDIKKEYVDELDRKIAYNAALVEKEGYGRLTRVEETIMFFKKMEITNVGLAFCVGLKEEASILQKILVSHGFTVNSLMCKSGSISKEFLGLEKKDFIRPQTREVMCNPIGQAEFLNSQKTEYNIVLGLCVGHDSLFIKYSEAPVTVMVVKDRVLCHNPVGALYQADKYYKTKLFPEEE